MAVKSNLKHFVSKYLSYKEVYQIDIQLYILGFFISVVFFIIHYFLMLLKLEVNVCEGVNLCIQNNRINQDTKLIIETDGWI